MPYTLINGSCMQSQVYSFDHRAGERESRSNHPTGYFEHDNM